MRGGLLQPVGLGAVRRLGNVRLRRCSGRRFFCRAGWLGVVISLPSARSGESGSVKGRIRAGAEGLGGVGDGGFGAAGRALTLRAWPQGWALVL